MSVHILRLIYQDPQKTGRDHKSWDTLTFNTNCSVMSLLLGWITLTDWFHLTLRPNLLNPTPNTWVSIVNAWSSMSVTFVLMMHFLAALVSLSEPPVFGAHLLLQRPLVCCGGEEARVGLRPHCHASACIDHQPWWGEIFTMYLRTLLTQVYWMCRETAMFCFRVAVMLEFPMVWQWWLALGKTNMTEPWSVSYCILLCEFSSL